MDRRDVYSKHSCLVGRPQKSYTPRPQTWCSTWEPSEPSHFFDSLVYFGKNTSVLLEHDGRLTHGAASPGSLTFAESHAKRFALGGPTTRRLGMLGCWGRSLEEIGMSQKMLESTIKTLK